MALASGGVEGGGHSHGAGAGGLDQGLAGQVHAGDFVGGVAVVETVGPLAVHLAHKDVADAAAVQGQGVGGLGHQGDVGGAVVEGDGGGGEGAEDVDDDDGSGGFAGVADEAAQAYFHLIFLSVHEDARRITKD